MGNSPSNSDDEDDKELREMDGNSSDGDDADDNSSLNLTDLSGLFNHTSLRTLAANIKEEVPENVLQQYRFQILRWLEDRENKLEETLTISQFCDWLQNKGVSREEAARTFQQFDTDGSGVVEVNTMLTIVKSMNGQNVMGELGRSIRMLQACSLTPGFVDVYARDHDAVQQHAEKILKYLIRNRSPSLSLPFPYLNGFNNTASMRNLVLKSIFQQMKDKGYGHGQGTLETGEEVRTINPCYSNIEVSSNTSDAYRLTNGDPNTFWQSDGSARSHWIRLHIKNNVVIKNLSVTVASSDSSYMPELISVSAGKNFRTLRSIKEVTIPSYITGDVTLLQNTKHYYPIIQINIKRCRNDGCDTRIHGIKTVGYKVIKEAGISVADASAMWYLQVLATTVTMTIPLAPHLRTGILDHTKKALGHIPPLSLCPVSGDRPKFLTKHVLQEVEKFVTDIALYEGEVLNEGLQVLLSFNLARGNVGALLRTVKLLQENPEVSLPCADLLRQMQQARDACWEKTGHQLTLTLSGSDGGQSDENTGPENVLNHSWTMPVQSSYLTSDGNTKVNMVFKSTETIQLSKLRIRVASGGKGARRGMVFVFKDDGSKFEMAKITERFKSYDSWGRQEYDYSVQVRNTGLAGKEDDPVAFFSFEDDCDELDVPVSWHPTGEYVLVKFVDTRQEATKMGIVGIKFYGFNRKLILTGEESRTYPLLQEKKSDCSSLEIIQTTLQFLIDLSQDQATKLKHGITGGKTEYLEFSDTPLEVIWSLYRSFNETEKWQSCALLTLKLLHCLLPVFTTMTEERKNSSAEFFDHICKLIDKPENKEQSSTLYELCCHLIIDGAAVFFPDKEARREQLFSMMRNVEILSKAPSVMLVFQSLCQFFSSVDPSGLLDLPKPNTQNYDVGKVLRIMETMISVSSHEFTATLKTGQSQVQIEPLLQLVSALQTSLLSWCWAQIVPEDDGKKELSNMWRENALQVISKYSVFVARKASEACKLLQTCDSKFSSIELLENSFLGSTVRQLVLILNFLCDSCCSDTRIQLIRSFQSLCEDLQCLSENLPKVFPPISSEHWASIQTEDIVLRTWEVESSHNYENNQHQTQVFTCPGANKFVIDFDPRCETERRYDYLTFNDAKGVQMRFDQKVGTSKWPKQVNFSGPHLHFLFHSDSSNTEWGYKFKVTARGSPDIPLSWPFDLQLSLTKLMGRLCGATLKANPFAMTDPVLGGVSSEQDVLRSELWTSLFRGGYMIGRLERSLSGKLATADSSVLEFLWNIINKKEGLPTKLIEKCKEQQKGVLIERGDTDEAILAVFAALVWHTQQLREDIQKLVQNPELTLSEGLLLAYSTAHSLKTQLLSQKQKLAAEKGENEEVQDPALACKEKALFLLKFAGLTKVQLKNEMRNKASKQWKKLLHRKDKQGRFDALEKYPSFRLVIDFVQDPAWITERVNSMLQQRSQHARAVAEVYSFCVQFLQIHNKPDIFQIPSVLFFQELLWYQDGFCKHYADSLDGCGLQQESVVRESFYSLIRKLTDPYHQKRRIQMEKSAVPAYEYIQACLLHLMDVEWHPYDLSFVQEVNLPALYLGIAKETVKMRECTFGQEEEKEELLEYNKFMKWFNECSEGFDKWYENAKKDESDKEEKKAVQMFVARFCDLLEVEITCDGCNVTLPGRRFRCLQCVDMDLCATCYAGGVKPEGEHTDDHDIVHLVYKCNKCQAFIVGTRIHCNVCDDFDLCYGCHEKGNFPPEHNSSHDITKFPLVKLRTSQDSDSLIQGYIHQHVWLLFTILSMSAGEIMMSSHVDLDYVKLAAQLQSQCMQIITHCLKQVPDDAEDSGKVLQQSDKSLQAIENRQMEAFAIHTQERIMGLLGAMIPRDNVVMSSGNFNFTTQDFIQLLFRIARGESGHEVNTRHLAMGLLGPLLNRCETQVADQAVISKEDTEDKIPGQHCISYLFTFGADCLQKCGLEWACSVSRILQSLYSSPEWKAVIHHHLNDCVQMLTSKPDLPSIFALFVMAGFPEVLTIGTLVSFTQYAGLERKTGVVLKHFPDKNQTLVIEIKTRKRHTIMDKYVDCVTSNEQIWDSMYISVFYRTTKTIIESIKEDFEVTVETAWVLSLCLKVLSNSLKNSNQAVLPELYQSSFIQCLVFIASKGTEFSQQWLLKDLEVLSLMLYTNQGGSATPGIKTQSLSLSERLAAALEKRSQSRGAAYSGLLDDGSDDLFLSSSSSSESSSDSDDEDSDDVTVTSGALKKGETDINKVFEDIDEKTRVMFETLHTDLKLPLDVLRAIYEMNDKSPDDVVKAIVENLETSPVTAKEDLKRLSEKWESIAHAKSPEAAIETAASDKVIDTGIHYHPALNQVNRVLEKASAEDHIESQKLIPTPDNDVESDTQKKERSKSSELLKQELEKHGRTCCRDYILKVNLAMSVLYARQVLASLLAQWPEQQGPVITAELLGCKDPQQIPCVLDLLNKTESRSRFQCVVEKIILYCEPNSLIPIAKTAGQFMEEVTLSSVLKESEHHYKESSTCKDTIRLPGASCLRISFDGRCSLKEGDKIVFSTSSNLQQNTHEFTGSAGANWTSFQVPGDVVYFEFTVNSGGGNTSWGYKFTVTAGTRDSFQTGYVILSNVLSTDLALNLHISELWLILVYVATKQTGEQRLKAIQLLLKILETQNRCPRVGKLKLDLSCLKPLWQLYDSSSKEQVDSGAVVPPVIRALTELFLQVEATAMNWGMTQEYLLAIQDVDELKLAVRQGIMNVAAVSTMIGYNNVATELIALVKKKKMAEK
ncbi:zinc finger ZZ-type and EF-hand domain-containing protein 1-like [Saccostrea echinata]|uniref:zinc finger ZZ-type and EF-hand domain-containing protein 1-like n=1 Tax=Saccostrea echinata TaxID=191078 RepID=UPI002A7F8CF1|nr:zinc finger ZZ-type and EF-hand domain-containing protein 1-like [Saccostrea echinata]